MHGPNGDEKSPVTGILRLGRAVIYIRPNYLHGLTSWNILEVTFQGFCASFAIYTPINTCRPIQYFISIKEKSVSD